MDTMMRYTKLQNGSDVRGVAVETPEEKITLTQRECMYIAAAFVSFLAEKTGRPPADLTVGVGHDSRVTADVMTEGTLRGIMQAGAGSRDCGLVSTPSMFMSTVLPAIDFDGSIMITASHLPFNRNGMKFFTKDGGLESADIKTILTKAAELDGTLDETAASTAEHAMLLDAYCGHIRDIIKADVKSDDYDHPLKGLHIVVDAGNGACGFFADKILGELGADTSGSVFLDADGLFPNHVPNPENAVAMDAVRQATVDAGADLGIIFDCDGDRAAVVLDDGEEINRNALIAMMAAILSQEHPGTTVVTDSITSDHLTEFLKGLGLTHHRFKRGYKNVINEAIRLNSEGQDTQLAIETSGHGALMENYFSDDGAYMSVRILCRLARCRREGITLQSLIADLKKPLESKEIRYHIDTEDFKAYGQQLLSDFEAYAKAQADWQIVKPNYEGIRVSFDDSTVKGWMLIRMSLHDPIIPVNFESDTQGGVAVIEQRLAPFLQKYDKLR